MSRDPLYARSTAVGRQPTRRLVQGVWPIHLEGKDTKAVFLAAGSGLWAAGRTERSPARPPRAATGTGAALGWTPPRRLAACTALGWTLCTGHLQTQDFYFFIFFHQHFLETLRSGYCLPASDINLKCDRKISGITLSIIIHKWKGFSIYIYLHWWMGSCHKRQKPQAPTLQAQISVTAKREKSQTPKLITAIQT